MPNHIHWIIILRDYDFDNGISDIGANDDDFILTRQLFP